MNRILLTSPVVTILFLGVFSSITFQAVPVIKIGEYSTFKLVDIFLIIFFTTVITKKIGLRTWIMVTVIFLAVIMQSLFLSMAGKTIFWSSTLIFGGRMVLITALVSEYFRQPQRYQLDAKIFKIYIRLVYFSIAYGCYESYLLLSGLAPAIIPDFINGGGEPILRLRGTFSEPSLFVLFITPAFFGQLLRRAYWSAIVIGVALVLTISTFAVIVALILLILFLTRRNALIICSIIGLAIALATYVFGWEFINYSFIEKFWTYLTFSATTDIISDSAGIRKSTASLGMKIAIDHFPLGVGYGQSIASLSAELPESLINSGFISSDIPIQSAFPQLIAESGLFGLISATPLIWASRRFLKGLVLRQLIAFIIYMAYMLTMVYPIENPIIWVFGIYYAIALRMSAVPEQNQIYTSSLARTHIRSFTPFSSVVVRRNPSHSLAR